MSDLVKISLRKLEKYIEVENYRGYDPYDALKSSLFNLPIFNNNKALRFGIQQLVKRSPINLRPLLGITKGYNPVTLGLCIQAFGYLSKIFPTKKNEYIKKAEYLINELEKLIPSGFSGTCWGYDFPWEAKNAKIPANQPTVVATGIITNGLFEYYKITNNQKAIDHCISASEFVLKDLFRTCENDSFCFSYSPFDKQKVYNASMKGARLLSQVYSITKNEEIKKTARDAVKYVVENQNSDGSWCYSYKRLKVDNYHTGYILDCLDDYIKCTGDDSFGNSLEKGYKYYIDSFFEYSGLPKFYNNNNYPVDCTAGGQSLLTLTRFGDLVMAEKTAIFLIKNMQSRSGYFYFRKFKNYQIKTSFMRWSNAWMFVALSKLLAKNI
ncbi:MAG: hypothetical protein KF816_09970 [Melioribacteraceae bacterium]|nr:hypothetical protein [Melioribacteraceae bacterium]